MARPRAGPDLPPIEGFVTAGVAVLRGAVPESFHRVHVAVADSSGRLVASAGDPARIAFLRSSAKPLQVLPVVEEGIADEYGLTDGDLAVCCGSHSAEPAHLERVLDVLRKADRAPEDLACGAHPPLRSEVAREALRKGEEFGPLHNNCSGKHAGMLALATGMGWSVQGYQERDHPVQRRMRAEVARWTGSREEEIEVAVDGCGVSTFAVPVSVMAGAFARFARAARAGETGPARIVAAMTAHPLLVAGTGRLDTDVMIRTGDRLFVKSGAEGVVCGGAPVEGMGVALKVEDGAGRAAGPAFLRVLRDLDLVGDTEFEALAAPRLRVTNTLDEVVGGLETEVLLEWRS